MKFINITDIPSVGVSHNPETKKKVFLAKGEIPNLNAFAWAVFKPGQGVESHVHQDFDEIFYVLSGRAEFIVQDKRFEVVPGSCVVVEAGEEHSQMNLFKEDVKWIFFQYFAMKNERPVCLKGVF